MEYHSEARSENCRHWTTIMKGKLSILKFYSNKKKDLSKQIIQGLK
jgi:hypothetical protein